MSRPRWEFWTGLVVASLLLGTALCFRTMKLGSVPGINGDEGWWGMQAVSLVRHSRLLFERTTAGNPVSLLFATPLSWVHHLAQPSFALLRSVSVITNLAAVALNFWIGCSFFGRRAGIAHGVLVALLPAAIAHSRFAQDPSQSIFATTLVIGCALASARAQTRAWLPSAAALPSLVVAVWVHPTNVFVAPFLLVPGVLVVFKMRPSDRRSRRFYWAALATLAALVALFAWLVVWPKLASYTSQHGFLNKPWLELASGRIRDGRHWLDFAKHYGRLFSGVTVYDYMSGAHLLRGVYDAAFAVVAILVVTGVVSLARTQGLSSAEWTAVSGWFLSLLVYVVFGGEAAIHPSVERYGLCLIVPGALFAALGFKGWLALVPRYASLVFFAAGSLGALALGAFYINYFREFATSGGRSEATFMTSYDEPKKLALELALSQGSAAPSLTIVAQEWWHYWPIRYLASVSDRVRVETRLHDIRPGEVEGAKAHGNLFFIEFVGHREEGAARAWAASHGLALSTAFVEDSSGRKLLAVMRARAR